MYASLDDLKAQLPEDLLVQLTDDNDSGTIDATITDTALETADVEIDGYLGERYTLPLSPVPDIINKQAVDIAIYNLYARRQGPPDHWQKRYDNVIRFLEKVARGDISLGIGDPEAGQSNAAVINSSDRVFSRDKLKGF
ncbi:MAG: DUF1320 domain-containing protein [Desulfocapsa sp.]|nr:DUF1320 domain-containing protein [Desulfocapsa sp.]MBN4048793.1 DUF1320 domain-containing protein [bacterium AH-315-N22]MBN4058795.1 DUF1320 domain-containing protein [Desulfocapsa sp. AH-315-J15]